jgi:hypothetical protein
MDAVSCLESMKVKKDLIQRIVSFQQSSATIMKRRVLLMLISAQMNDESDVHESCLV